MYVVHGITRDGERIREMGDFETAYQTYYSCNYYGGMAFIVNKDNPRKFREGYYVIEKQLLDQYYDFAQSLAMGFANRVLSDMVRLRARQIRRVNDELYEAYDITLDPDNMYMPSMLIPTLGTNPYNTMHLEF